eukprot:gene21263-27286_t
MLSSYHGVDDVSIEGRNILVGLVNENHYHEAKLFLDLLLNKNVVIDSKALALYMQLALKLKDFEAANNIADYIASVDPVPHKGIIINSEGYASMIRFAGNLGLFDEALKYYELSKRGGAEKPSILCLHNLLVAVTSAKFEQTNLQHLFYFMSEAHKYEVIPTQMMYFLVIKIFCRMRDTLHGEFYFFEFLRNFYPLHNLSKRVVDSYDKGENMDVDTNPADVNQMFFWLVSSYRLRIHTILQPPPPPPQVDAAPPAAVENKAASASQSNTMKNKLMADVLRDSQPYSEEEALHRESNKWAKLRGRIINSRSFFTSPFTTVHAEVIGPDRRDMFDSEGQNKHKYNPNWAFQRLDQQSEVYSLPPVDLSLDQCVHRAKLIMKSMSQFGVIPNSAVRREYLHLLAVAGRVAEAENTFSQLPDKVKQQPDYAIMICLFNEVKDYAKAHAMHKQARDLGFPMRSDVSSFRLFHAASMPELSDGTSKVEAVAMKAVSEKPDRKTQLQSLGGEDLVAMRQTGKRLGRFSSLNEKMREILGIKTQVRGEAKRPSKMVIDQFLRNVDIDMDVSLSKDKSASLQPVQDSAIISPVVETTDATSSPAFMPVRTRTHIITSGTTAERPIVRRTTVVSAKNTSTVSVTQLASRFASVNVTREDDSIGVANAEDELLVVKTADTVEIHVSLSSTASPETPLPLPADQRFTHTSVAVDAAAAAVKSSTSVARPVAKARIIKRPAPPRTTATTFTIPYDSQGSKLFTPDSERVNTSADKNNQDTLPKSTRNFNYAAKRTSVSERVGASHPVSRHRSEAVEKDRRSLPPNNRVEKPPNSNSTVPLVNIWE